MTAQSSTPTVEEIWRKYDHDEQRLTAIVSERMLDLAGIQPGQRVLDLATGRGEPAIRAAHRVGPAGCVVGVDSSASMLTMAQERAIAEGLSNLELHVVSAETLDGLPHDAFDVTLARWGLMYMNNPIAAMKAARLAMRRGGTFVAAFWAEPHRVSYFTLPRQVLAKFQTVPEMDPEAPGTFRYADEARIRRDFFEAGLTIEHIEEMTVPVMEAATDAELIAWTRSFGMNRLLAELPDEVQKKWEAELIQATANLRVNGVIQLGGTTRLVVAKSP